MLRTPPPTDCMIWNTMMPAKSTGPKMAETQNHFVRTRSMNSRRMTAQTLRTGASVPASRRRRGRFGTDQVHENLVERRARQLEAREACTGADERPQDLLGVRTKRELQLGLLTEILDLRHQAPVGEDLLRAPLTAVERDDHVLTAVCALHLGERAVDEFLPPRDDAKPVAELLGVFHDVRREQHGLARAAVLHDRVSQHLRIDGIKPGERLVENDEIGIVQNCRDELNLLLHTLRQIGDLPHPPGGEAHAVETRACLLARDTPRHTLRFREKDQYIEHTHLRVEPALLVEVPDVRGMLPTPTDLAEKAHYARVWLVDIHDHADRRRLAGAVWT